jgi:hypothetical protein
MTAMAVVLSASYGDHLTATISWISTLELMGQVRCLLRLAVAISSHRQPLAWGSIKSYFPLWALAPSAQSCCEILDNQLSSIRMLSSTLPAQSSVQGCRD